MNTVPAEQYRIEQIQILNWGGYGGLQVLQAGRTSTAILGPSGRGKVHPPGRYGVGDHAEPAGVQPGRARR